MSETHRVVNPYVWLLGRHVEAGEKVWPGKPLFDIAAIDGVIETVCALGFGEIGHIEGELIKKTKFSHLTLHKPHDLRKDGDSLLIRLGPCLGAVYEEGAILCQILPMSIYGGGANKSPRPTSNKSVSRRREAGINLQ